MHISPPTLCASLPCLCPRVHLPSDLVPGPLPPCTSPLRLHAHPSLMRVPPVPVPPPPPPHVWRPTLCACACASPCASARLPPAPDPGDWQNGQSLSFYCTPGPLLPTSCTLLCGGNPIVHPDPPDRSPACMFYTRAPGSDTQRADWGRRGGE